MTVAIRRWGPALLLLAALGPALTVPACTTPGPIVGQGGQWAILQDELRKSDAKDLLELIQELRPSWLLAAPLRDPADPTETEGPLVLINDVPSHPLFVLQSIRAEGVTEIRYLTRTSALNRYRVSAPWGLIVVIRPPSLGSGERPDTGRGRHAAPTF